MRRLVTNPVLEAALQAQGKDWRTFTRQEMRSVVCADCHMPYTRDGAVKFSNHNVHSPLFNPAASCGTCHTNVDYVVGRVTAIQNQVWVTMSASEDALVEAIAAIKTAAETTGADPQLIEEARALQRAAQLRWDFIAAENSMGFHNPEEALRILAAATDLARQAQLKAVQAVSSTQSASR